MGRFTEQGIFGKHAALPHFHIDYLPQLTRVSVIDVPPRAALELVNRAPTVNVWNLCVRKLSKITVRLYSC
jgi:hypothetical protein